MTKTMLLPCNCSECDNRDCNQNGIFCMCGYPQFTDDGECEAFELVEGGADDET